MGKREEKGEKLSFYYTEKGGEKNWRYESSEFGNCQKKVRRQSKTARVHQFGKGGNE